MKILLLCNYYHRAVLFYYHKRALEKRGHTVHVFNAVPFHTQVEEPFGFVMDDTVIQCACFHKWDRFFYFHKQKKIYEALCRHVDPKDYDLIHAHMVFSTGYAAYKLCRAKDASFAVSVRNTDVNVFWRIPFLRRVADRVLDSCVGVHFLSEGYREACEKLFAKPLPLTAVIPTGLDPYYLAHKAHKSPAAPSDCLRLICVGKIDANKNWLTTCKACQALIDAGWSVHLTAVGPVRNRRIYRALTRMPFVTCRPFMAKESLQPLYRAHHIFVMPSRTESFGRVYAEAMTQGLPVIYTRSQGFDRLFADGEVGYGVAAGDAGAIAQAVRRIVDDYDAMAARCLARVSRFDWDTLAAEWASFYARCTALDEEEALR